MGLIIYVEAIDGPQKGTLYLLENGTTFGRSQGDIILKDSKVSSLHAKVDVDSAGRYSLLDLNSANGLWIGEQKVKKISLLPGLVFNVGRFSFKVHEAATQDIDRLGLVKPWKSRLHDLLSEVTVKNQPLQDRGLPFVPALHLEFIQGIQSTQSITFYYGPRQIGRSSLDLELLDPQAPDQAFEVIPQGRSCKIKIFDPQKVLINNHSLKEHLLNEGDLICIGNTLIQVSYI